MAMIERELFGDLDDICYQISNAVMNGSVSATLEGQSRFSTASGVCFVMVFERYSAFGGNRVSMNITLFQSDGRIFLTAITSGGSQAMFFKINTFGEQSFLDTVASVINSYSQRF